MTYEGDKKIITGLMQEVVGLMWHPTVDFSLILCHQGFPNQMTFSLCVPDSSECW